MNDLAWVLQELGQLDEAESLIRSALKMSDKIGTAWDTLGMIMMKRGKLQEAGEFFKKALTFNPDLPSVQFHMAVLLEKTGDVKKAAELAENLLVRPIGLSQSEQDDLRRMSRRIGGK